MDKQALSAEPDRMISNEKLEQLKRQLSDLEKEERPGAAEEVRRTGEMGDLSENAAYQYAKAHLRRVNGRILSLQDRIASAVLIETPIDDGVVRIGSTVTVTTSDREMIFQILGSQETDPLKGRISYSSPLGAALIGHAVGEEVVANKTTFRILRVT